MKRQAKGKSNLLVRLVQRLRRWVARWIGTVVLAFLGVTFVAVLAFAVINPPGTIYMWQEHRRLGSIDRQWVPLEAVAPVMARSVLAAEDANFCLHWGFDMEAIRTAIEQGAVRGASTISQQTVKNVYLWHGRSWIRKALEAAITPVVELVWTKRRILEVYLNVAEFDTGVFGIEAAARHHFGTGPDKLTPMQAALLAAVLPDPKGRSAVRPSERVSRRAREIRDGAATLLRDGRADCIGPKSKASPGALD